MRVVAALFCRGSTVLVQQRPPGKKQALLWEFPGGKVEPGESDADALVRECREELGVDATVGELVWSARHDYPGFSVELMLYRATMADDATPHAHDAHQIAWVERERLAELPFCEADVPLLSLLATREIP